MPTASSEFMPNDFIISVCNNGIVIREHNYNNHSSNIWVFNDPQEFASFMKARE